MTVWDVLIDAGLFGMLLLIGQFFRAKFKIFQSLLMPASLIGGFIGLLLGPSGYDILPFSNSIAKYAGILIAVVFAATPIGDESLTKEDIKGIGGFFYQNTGILILQYLFGMGLFLCVLKKFWPKLNDGFGLVLATGFYGGHGTAAAVGEIYREHGWPEFFDLGNVSATVGIVGGIIGGMVLINWATRKGYTVFVDSPKDLPNEIRTGLIPKDKQKLAGKITISNMSLDPLAFHLSLVLAATLLGKWLSMFIKSKITWLSVPVFVSALIFGYVVQSVLKRTNTLQYVDRQTIQRISSTATDLLVVSAISSLKLSVISNNIGPLLITFSLGFLVNVAWLLYVSKYASTRCWFERGIMNYGRSNGVVATGVLLNRVVDPEQKSRGLEDTGITDLLNRPIAVVLQVAPPLFLIRGGKWPLYVTLAMGAAFVLLTVIALVFKWWTPGKMQGGQKS